jgi:hypothetical protein
VANERTPLYPQAIAGVTRPAYEPGERDTAVLALGASAGLRIALLAAVLGLLMACLLSTGSSWPLPQLLRGVMGGWLAVLMMNVLLVAAWAALAAVR